MRYRKRPVIVEARGPLTEPEFVTTAHGRVRAEAGDYVLLAESGDTWPIKPDIFAATYEPVEDEAAPRVGTPDRAAYEAGARDMRERAASVIESIADFPPKALDTSQVGGIVESEMRDLVRSVTQSYAVAIRALPLRAEDKS